MQIKKVLNTAVVVAALGYFVDVYDLVLFLIVGKKSLAEIGIATESIIDNFQYLLNVQMVGMLLGGLFFGILGDKLGRLSVLFGSIVTYSLANLANGFVVELSGILPFTDVLGWYTILRFVAGFGLAGELGAGITLVSEILDKEGRGLGTMLVASIGVMGAVVAGAVGQMGWQICYIIGGLLGFSLLLLRVGVAESGMFASSVQSQVERGNIIMLFNNWGRFKKYLYCISIGLPVWYIIGVLVGLSPVFAKLLGVEVGVEDAYSVMLCYGGLVFGDIASGTLSNIWKSRKKVFFLFYGLCITVVTLYLQAEGMSLAYFNFLIFMLGFSVGFWAIFVTVASEQFGTNIRATVTTTIPNFVRGSLVLIVLLLNSIKKGFGLSLIEASAITGIIVFTIAIWALIKMPETFGKDLDYFEK
jgi:MFS family permease